MATARRLLSGDAALALLSCMVASGIGVITLRLWRADLQIPLRYDGDATQILGYTQNVMETGWFLNAPRLGAPFGQSYHDFPLGPENLHFLIIRLLGGITGDAVATVTLFYLLTFPLITLAAFWAFRQLGIAGPVAAFTAIVYAILPFHFTRSTGHLLLAAYYCVPLACFVLVKAIDGRPLFGFGAGSTRSRRTRSVAVLGAVVLAWILASAGAYFAAFTLMLLIPATLIGWLQFRTRAIIASGALMAGLIVGFLLLNNAPTFLYWFENGGNPDVPVRLAIETASHQLRPISLIMPVPGHRLGPLAGLAAQFATWRTGENGEPLGMLGAIGFVALIVIALGALIGLFKNGRTMVREKRLAALTLIALVLTTSGGLSTLIALVVTAQIRGWSRISIFIGFFALLAVALVLTLAWRWASRKRWRIPAALALVVLLVVVAVEQTSPAFVPPYATSRERFLADKAFVQSVEASLPTGAAIYQLPYREYPEAGPRADARDYDHLRLYLHSKALRSSYAGMKGREAGWQTYVYARPPADALPLLNLAGFSAVWVDRYAYSDRGEGVEQELRAETNAEPLVSADGRFSVFDIRPYGERLTANMDPAVRADLEGRLLEPVWLRWDAGARAASIEDGDGTIDRPIGPSAELNLLNAGAEREVTVSFEVETDGSRAVTITWPDGSTQSVTPTPSALVSRTLVLPPGPNQVQFEVDSSVGPRATGAHIHDLWVVDTDLLAVEPPAVP